MEINTVIEVQSFGDFDVKYTDCVMIHSDKIDKNEILKEFYDIHGLSSIQYSLKMLLSNPKK